MIEINYLAVVVAAVASMGLGALWYSPILFGKQWMAATGFDVAAGAGAQKGMLKSYALQFVGALVMAYVLAHFVRVWGAAAASDALQLGFWTWLGFVAPVMMGAQLWEGKPWKLFLITGGYQLVSLSVASVILTLLV